MSTANIGNVEPQTWRTDSFRSDFQLSKLQDENSFAPDHYEILRIRPDAEEETIERVYRTLADRFHPDNPSTGDRETFLRLSEAYDTLSSPVSRAKYNVLREYSRGSARFRLRSREFFAGVRGGQNRRLAVLCLLYRQKISTHDFPGLSILDLEQITGCTREEVTAALWYLCEKGWTVVGEFTTFSITAEGLDVVERKLEDRLEFRSLATISYYRTPLTRGNTDALPLDIEPAITSEGELLVCDHYEILGIPPQADSETIERVYRTMAARFHPDNPSSGDAKTFLRIQEAYATLSDRAAREQYDALRQRTRHSERFRFRGREFFDGIRGEQLRRLAVLCVLYRHAASELPGLTVLDLEQLTGCTREELGPALWYLREKKWAKAGEFTDYSITALGFDIVENKLDDREPVRAQEWLFQEVDGNKALDAQAGVVETAAQSPDGISVTSQYLIPDSSLADGSGNSQTAAIRPANILQDFEQIQKAMAPPDEKQSVTPEPAQMENTSGPATGSAVPASETETFSRANWNALFAGMSATDIYQDLLRLQNVMQASGKELVVTEETDRKEKVTGGGEACIRLEAVEAPSAGKSSEAGEIAYSHSEADRILESERSDIDKSRSLRVFFRRLLGRDIGGKPEEHRQQSVPYRAQSPMSFAFAPEKQSPDWGTKQEQSDVRPGSESQIAERSARAGMVDAAKAVARAEKRVIFSMGGKGGVGKTSVMTGMAEWFEENQIPVTLLDLDIENKACGSLTHFFDGRVPKINIHTPAGLDAFVDYLAEDTFIILADMGAGAGHVAYDWFEKMYPEVAESGVAFTAVGVVTSDPASVESVLSWSAALQNRVQYVVVENKLSEHADFTYWEKRYEAHQFRDRFHPQIVRMDNRLADLENAARSNGVTLGRVARRTTSTAELQKASMVMRAQSYRRRMFAEFDKAKESLLP